MATNSKTVFNWRRHTRPDWNWPTLVCVAALVAFTFGVKGNRYVVSSGMERIDEVISRTFSKPEKLNHVLILTSNPEKQKCAILTLSPRGLTPLLPRSLNDMKQMISNPAFKIRLAVLDESFPNAAVIAQLLRKKLPSNSIVFVNASSRPQDVGPLLLNSF